MNLRINKENIEQPSLNNGMMRKLVLKTMHSIYLFEIEDVMRCESIGNYTKVFVKEGPPVLVSKTLKEFEEFFKLHKNFIRIHHSHVINLNYMSRMDKKEGGIIIMKDKSSIPVAIRKKVELLSILESL